MLHALARPKHVAETTYTLDFDSLLQSESESVITKYLLAATVSLVATRLAAVAALVAALGAALVVC